MSLIPNMDDLFKDSPLSSLRFTFSDLQVLYRSLISYQIYLESDSDNPHCTDEGLQESDIVSDLLSRFCSYCFK